LKLLIMVNDFGAINIDADLLASRDEDTIALTNGCVCCTMGADLFMAIDDVLARNPRPDHLIIEASGVADPAQIANAAIAEPDLRYAGIVTVVDGPDYARLSNDPLIGPQVVQQVKRADLVWVSKAPSPKDIALIEASVPVLAGRNAADLMALLTEDIAAPQMPAKAQAHPAYVAWSHEGTTRLDGAAIRAALAKRPAGLFRVKGTLAADGQQWNVQVVGQQIEVRKQAISERPMLVGIGLAALVTRDAVDAWFEAELAP
jgi:G3E family GTPase